MGFIMYVCPQCRKIFKISGSGKKAKCPKCKDPILLETGVEESIWQTYTPILKKEIISSMLDEPEVIEVEEIFDEHKPVEKKSSFFDVDIPDTPTASNQVVRKSTPQQPIFENDSDSYFEPNIQSAKTIPASNNRAKPSKPKDSTLSVIALIASVLGCFAIVGLILAIIDLTNKDSDGKNHTYSYVAFGICAAWAFVAIFSARSANKKDEASIPTSITEEAAHSEPVLEIEKPEPTQAESTVESEQNKSASDTNDLEVKYIDNSSTNEIYKAQTIDEQGDRFKGKTVLTYGRIYNDASADGYMQISVPDTVHGIDCYLANDSKCSLNDLKKDDIAIVEGTITGTTDALFFKQVKMEDCHIIGFLNTSLYDSDAAEKGIAFMDESLKDSLTPVESSTDGSEIDTSESVADDSSESSSDSSSSLFGTHDVDKENAIETTAKTVYKEMKDNQVACKTKYNGKTVKMKGVVDSIGTNIFGQEYVSFDVGDPYSIEGVQIFFKNDQMNYVAGLKKGQTITVYGIAEIGSMTFKMGNCFPAD